MKKLLMVALLLCALVSQSQVRVIVVPEKNQDTKMIAASEAIGCKTIQQYDQLGWYLLELPSSMSIEKYQRKTRGLFQMVYPDVEMVYHRDYIPNDPYFVQSWHLRSSTDKDIDADEAWDSLLYNGSYTTVAVFDGGLETNHEDLVGRWNTPFNAVTNEASAAFVNSFDKHGTACSGTIAATVNNAIGVAGVGGNCVQVMPVNIMSNVYSGGSFSTTSAIQINAVNAAMANPTVAAISMSYGGSSYSAALEAAFEIARVQGRGGKGILVFASSGNGYSATANQYPANYINVIGVGATNSSDVRASFSNYGPICDISAPGAGIWTTDRIGAEGYSTSSNYASVSGTSFSCPITAGAAALMAYKNSNLSAAEIYAILSSTCEKVGGYAYTTVSGYPHGTRSNELGYGRINLKNALIAAGNGELPPPPTPLHNLLVTSITVSPSAVNPGTSITINASAGTQNSDLDIVQPQVECRISTDNVWSSNDISVSIDTLVVGGGMSFWPVQYTYTPTAPGTYYALIKINGDGNVAESSSADNLASIMFSVTDPLAAGLDASISLILPTSTNVTLTSGTVFNCKWRVTNTGTTTITSISTGRKWAVCNNPIYCNETINNWSGTLLPGQSVMLPGTNSYVSVNACNNTNNCPVPAGGSNTYNVRIVSVNGQLTDANLANNIVPIVVTRPTVNETDIVVYDLHHLIEPGKHYNVEPILSPGFYAIHRYYSDGTVIIEKKVVE